MRWPDRSIPGTVVVKDSTISAYTWGNRLMPVMRPRTSIMPNSFAIGLGLPHALGAAVRSKVSPVVLLAGDGGFLLSAGELATVASEGLAIVVVVFVDGGYGILRNIQESQYGSPGRIGVDLGRPDFCRLAEAFGIGSERVEVGRRLCGGNQAGTRRAGAFPGGGGPRCHRPHEAELHGHVEATRSLGQTGDDPAHGVAAGIDVLGRHRQRRAQPEGPLAAPEGYDVLVGP